MSSDSLSFLTWGALSVLAWTIYGAIWRLYLSPLAAFPGPKIVALTSWVEFYHDVVKKGTYMWEIEKMHQKYGPIVRVSPYELHCIDPDFYNVIYASLPQKRDKYEKFTKSPDCNNATGFTVEHAHHRMRRDALAPFFSKRNTLGLEDSIKACVDQLCANIARAHAAQEPFNLTLGSIATTMDVLTSYSFGQPFGLLADEALATQWRDTVFHIMRALPIVRAFPLLVRLVDLLPPIISKWITPDLSILMGWKQRIRKQTEDVLAYRGIYSDPDRKATTVIEALRDSDKLPPKEKTLQRLSEEGAILLIAGSETPAKVNAVLWYHLLANPTRLQRLRTELASIYPDPKHPLPSVTELEKLPYLNACILEGLRLQSGVSGRSHRLAPTSLSYGNWTIPARTPLSSISVFQHYNPVRFPDPQAFFPERWLLEDGSGIRMDLKRSLVAFGAGTRYCLGTSLAYAELYLMAAALATRVDMELFETTVDDVKIMLDWTIPQPKPDTQGVRVKVRAVHMQ
ncbi:cytochrome P450 [Aspergillus piperis CBS 112811]|uniref:Cytochrome P450 n=1 Tax=Aspergillus piperis CBS 112811 TaxID=1448313 RepID=A0A8G1R5X9_9EURO|nr:cytochrome P450 [Aspergillus piperis CBS 112811]RAH57400.1 cytochrome P450 [Aspergillus piperis CBS 112811]